MATRHLACALTEIKLAPAANDGVDAMTFEGYGAVFGNVDAYGDVIAPGAFANFLADAKSGRQPWPAMLSQHGGMGLTATDDTPVGIWLDLAEDGTGLKVKGKLADTPRGRELHSLMKMTPRPAIDGLSIGYIAKEAVPRSKPEEPRRTLKRVDLIEVSLVTFPANGKARISSVKQLADNEREIEAWLMRDAGLSAREAKTVISHGFKHLLRERDAAAGELAELAEALKRRGAALAA